MPAFLSAAGPSLAPQPAPPAAAASIPAALTAAHISLAPQPLLIQHAPASTHLMDHDVSNPHQLPLASPALVGETKWHQGSTVGSSMLPGGNSPDLHDPLAACSQVPGPPQPSLQPQPPCSQAAVCMDHVLLGTSQYSLQQKQQHSCGQQAPWTTQQAPSPLRPASPDFHMEEPPWHDDACVHDAPDPPSPPAWGGSPGTLHGLSPCYLSCCHVSCIHADHALYLH